MVLSLLIQFLYLMPGTINFFLSHPSVYLKVFILLSLVVLYNVNEADGIRKQTVYAPRGSGQGALAYPKPTRVF